MKSTPILILSLLLSLFSGFVIAQSDSSTVDRDSVNVAVLKEYNKRLLEFEQQRVADSVMKTDLEQKLSSLKNTENLQKTKLLEQLKTIEENDSQRRATKDKRIDSLRINALGYPVVSVMSDTLFYIYSKLGASMAWERARNVSAKIKLLYEDDFLNVDSILVVNSEYTYDIVYKDAIIMSVSETDAIWYNMSMAELSKECTTKIQQSIELAKKENSLERVLIRIGLALLVVAFAWIIFRLVRKGYGLLLDYIHVNQSRFLKNLSYKDYTFLSAEQELQTTLFLLKLFHWLVYALLLYLTLPIVFSIFPFSRNWADALFMLIWSPFKGMLLSVWDYMPKLFTILVILFVMKYVIRLVKYIFMEIELGKLKISGFHQDWAIPTWSIVRFLLYAFMFVLIFPSLPGSSSKVFQGVSVFIGVLFSLGSSTAIANMVAGLVITYMRPFKIGDRIMIGNVTGDVVEKTLLVTRIVTIKNEVITIPNSAVLSGNTTNYSMGAEEKGLIIHSSVSIGYDVPWKEVSGALIEAALRTPMVMKRPVPFVLQTSLDDFYVVYQINCYTKEASKQALIYSSLHQHILDVCNEKGIEIMSPHYRSERDGNKIAIPDEYLSKILHDSKTEVELKVDEGTNEKQ